MDSRDRDALIADKIRWLVADTSIKLDDESTDRQCLVEDILTRLLELAGTLDGRRSNEEALEGAHTVYNLASRDSLGELCDTSEESGS
jgi:hypothetical protein